MTRYSTRLSRWLIQRIWDFTIPRPRRRPRRGPERNPAYREFVRRHPCCACSATWEVEAAHTGAHGISQKSSDYSCVPLCATCHQLAPDSLHAIGPARFQKRNSISFERIISELRSEHGGDM